MYDGRMPAKELKNSESTAETAPVSIAVFLRPKNERTDVFCVGRQQLYNTREGKAVGRTVDRFLTSRHLGATLKNVSPRYQISSTGDVSMSMDTQGAPASAARQIAYYFGLIADTLDWNHADWLALGARLEASGKPVHALTLADVETAVTATRVARSEVRHDA